MHGQGLSFGPIRGPHLVHFSFTFFTRRVNGRTTNEPIHSRIIINLFFFHRRFPISFFLYSMRSTPSTNHCLHFPSDARSQIASRFLLLSTHNNIHMCIAVIAIKFLQKENRYQHVTNTHTTQETDAFTPNHIHN